MSRPRIVIADDHTLMTDGLRRLLEPEFDVVGTAATGKELLSVLETTPAEVVVLDIAMPEMNGIEAARTIGKSYPLVKLVFVTQQVSRHYIQAAFQAGAYAFVSKQSASNDLHIAIRTALRGEKYLTASTGDDSRQLLNDLNNDSGDILEREMTPRQLEVLRLTAEGKTVKEIGSTLNISPKTVEFHKAAVMDHLGLRNTADLTRYALSRGIVSA